MSTWYERWREQYAHIPRLTLDEMRALPECEPFQAGVYFLWGPDDVLNYVGKSPHVAVRIEKHARDNRYDKFHVDSRAVPFERHTCLVVDDESERLAMKLQDLERTYMAFYEPLYCYPGQSTTT